jgi:hypothetical protein
LSIRESQGEGELRWKAIGAIFNCIEGFLAKRLRVLNSHGKICKRRPIVKKICLLVLLVTLLGVRSRPVFTQTSAELLNTSKTTENITTESMGYDRKNYSPLKQINTSNVKRLVPIWNSSLMNDLGELAAPVVYNGVMYVINGKWTFAIDVETGRQIWRTPVEIEPGITRSTITSLRWT